MVVQRESGLRLWYDASITFDIIVAGGRLRGVLSTIAHRLQCATHIVTSMELWGTATDRGLIQKTDRGLSSDSNYSQFVQVIPLISEPSISLQFFPIFLLSFFKLSKTICKFDDLWNCVRARKFRFERRMLSNSNSWSPYNFRTI